MVARQAQDTSFDAAQALRLAQQTFDIEAAAVLGLKARTGEAFAQRRAADAGRARARGGDGHRQERAHRPQDRRHAGVDRHARDVRAPGRGQPRRPGHDQADRPGAGAVQQRRGRRGDEPAAGHQAPGRQADRDDRQRRLHAGPPCGHRAGQRRREGSLPAATGAHRQHHGATGAGRRAGGRAAGCAGLSHRGLRALASGRRARAQAADAPGRRDAHRRGRAARGRPTPLSAT